MVSMGFELGLDLPQRRGDGLKRAMTSTISLQNRAQRPPKVGPDALPFAHGMHLLQCHGMGVAQVVLLAFGDGLCRGFILQQHIVFKVEIKAAQAKARNQQYMQRQQQLGHE